LIPSKNVLSLSEAVGGGGQAPVEGVLGGLPAVAIKPSIPNLDEQCRQQNIGSFMTIPSFQLSTWNKSNKYSTLNFYSFDVLWPKYGILRAKIPF